VLRFYYDQTSIEGGPGLVEFTSYVNLDASSVHVTTNAEQSSIGSNTLVIEDPGGAWLMTGHRKVLVIEDAAPTENQLIGMFYVGDRDVDRLDAPTATSRKWTVTLTDINTLIARRIMAGNDTDRPEETDVERIQWLLATSEANAFDDVTTYVSTADPVNMSDSNYNGQALQSIVDDCAQQSGKNAYLRWIWDAGSSSYIATFWYGDDNLAAAESSLRISNVIGDVDNATTWYASADAKLHLDPSRVYSSVFGNFDGGWSYRTRSATVTDFARRDTTASWPNVRRQARADSRGDRYLNTLHTEEATVTVSIYLPPENVNDAHAGDKIDARFVHFPMFDDFTACRILNKTTTFLTPEFYLVTFELSLLADYAPTPPAGPPPPDCQAVYQVPLEGDVPVLGPMRVNYGGAFDPGGGTGSSLTDYGEYVTVYGGATYAVHTYDTSFIGPQPLSPIQTVLTNSSTYLGDIGSTDCGFVPAHTAYCPPLSERIDYWVHPAAASGVPTTVNAQLGFLPWTGHNPVGSSWYVVLTYISGPDPRFESLPPCEGWVPPTEFP